jgi:hypothetical protein
MWELLHTCWNLCQFFPRSVHPETVSTEPVVCLTAASSLFNLFFFQSSFSSTGNMLLLQLIVTCDADLHERRPRDFRGGRCRQCRSAASRQRCHCKALLWPATAAGQEAGCNETKADAGQKAEGEVLGRAIAQPCYGLASRLS